MSSPLTPFDPASLRPLVEALSPTAIVALHQVAADRPCWRCPIEAHGGLASVWSLADRANGFEQGLTLPVEPEAILEAAEEVLRAKGYTPAGWNLTTVMGIRAWLTIDLGGGRGRGNVCYAQSEDAEHRRPIEIAMWVLGQADQLPRAADPEPLRPMRRDEDEPTIS